VLALLWRDQRKTLVILRVIGSLVLTSLLRLVVLGFVESIAESINNIFFEVYSKNNKIQSIINQQSTCEIHSYFLFVSLFVAVVGC
jgi:hypothetical protein